MTVRHPGKSRDGRCWISSPVFGCVPSTSPRPDLDGRRRSFRPSQEWKLLGAGGHLYWSRLPRVRTTSSCDPGRHVRTGQLAHDPSRWPGWECVRSIAFSDSGTSAGISSGLGGRYGNVLPIWLAGWRKAAAPIRALPGPPRIAGSVNFQA